MRTHSTRSAAKEDATAHPGRVDREAVIISKRLFQEGIQALVAANGNPDAMEPIKKRMLDEALLFFLNPDNIIDNPYAFAGPAASILSAYIRCTMGKPTTIVNNTQAAPGGIAIQVADESTAQAIKEALE